MWVRIQSPPGKKTDLDNLKFSQVLSKDKIAKIVEDPKTEGRTMDREGERDPWF